MQLLLINLQAICGEFRSHLEDDDRKEEKVRLARLKDGGEYLTPEEREVDARPTYAGEYWKPWTDFRAAEKLFADEVALIDDECRDKTNKKTLGDRTIAVRKWFGGLPASKLEEAKKAAEKWNAEGAPDRDRMHM
jgi:hypothetical protein